MKPGTMTAAQVHKQYSEAVTAFRRWIPDPTLRQAFNREADSFFQHCALGVWQGGPRPGPSHPSMWSSTNAIYSGKNLSPSPHLHWEGGLRRGQLPTCFQPPAFFQALRDYDRRKGTTLARRFADQTTLISPAVRGGGRRGQRGAEAGFVQLLLRHSAGAVRKGRPVRRPPRPEGGRVHHPYSRSPLRRPPSGGGQGESGGTGTPFRRSPSPLWRRLLAELGQPVWSGQGEGGREEPHQPGEGAQATGGGRPARPPPCPCIWCF